MTRAASCALDIASMLMTTSLVMNSRKKWPSGDSSSFNASRAFGASAAPRSLSGQHLAYYTTQGPETSQRSIGVLARRAWPIVRAFGMQGYVAPIHHRDQGFLSPSKETL